MNLSAQNRAFLVFTYFIGWGLLFFFSITSWFLAIGSFTVMAGMGMFFANKTFKKHASMDEKIADLEDRVRNSD